jgi:hypothetical protein
MNLDHPELSSSQVLAKLVSLRHTDFDAFMELLYSSLQNELKGAIFDATPMEEKRQALDSMIQYFSDKEEYEKCAVLRDINLSLTN